MSSVTLQYNTTHQDREITYNPKPGNYNSLPKQRRNNIQPKQRRNNLLLFLLCLGLEVISSLFGIGGYFCFVWVGCYFFFVWAGNYNSLVWDWRLFLYLCMYSHGVNNNCCSNRLLEFNLRHQLLCARPYVGLQLVHRRCQHRVQ
jgi:hypothetical protein